MICFFCRSFLTLLLVLVPAFIFAVGCGYVFGVYTRDQFLGVLPWTVSCLLATFLSATAFTILYFIRTKSLSKSKWRFRDLFEVKVSNNLNFKKDEVGAKVKSIEWLHKIPGTELEYCVLEKAPKLYGLKSLDLAPTPLFEFRIQVILKDKQIIVRSLKPLKLRLVPNAYTLKLYQKFYCDKIADTIQK